MPRSSVPIPFNLLEFARRHDAVVIEDDYDGESRFGGRPLDALQTLDRDGRVFYVGAFSKSLLPALRLGFVVVPVWAREALVAVKYCADSHSEPVPQAALAAFIRGGRMARHVRRMQRIYAARRDDLLQGLRRELAPWLEPIASEAGLHLAAPVRNPGQIGRVMAEVREFAPGAQSGNDYAMGALPQPAIAFGYGVMDTEAIPPALQRLASALASPRIH